MHPNLRLHVLTCFKLSYKFFDHHTVSVYQESGIYNLMLFMILNLDIIFSDLYDHVLLMLVLLQMLIAAKKRGWEKSFENLFSTFL